MRSHAPGQQPATSSGFAAAGRSLVRWLALAGLALAVAGCASSPSSSPSSSTPAAPGSALVNKPGELPGFVGDGRNTSYPELPRLFTLAAPLPASVVKDETLAPMLATQRKVVTSRTFPASQPLDGLPAPVTQRSAQAVLEALERWSHSNRPLSDFVQGYQLQGDGRGNVRFTSYYTPTISLSDRRGGAFTVPIYRKPDGNGPFPSRTDISRGALAGRNLEIAWTNSLIDLYFLQVQGSGVGIYPDGRRRLLSYGGKNGHSYVSIGRKLVEQGEIPVDQVSMQTIRAWMTSHPGQAEPVMNLNGSYTFLSFAQNEVTGSAGVPLTPLASAATDSTILPPGTVVLIEMPILDAAGRVDHYQPRLLAVQDRGGAIKGSERLDIYAGAGPQAEQMAGTLKHFGRLWLLLPK